MEYGQSPIWSKENDKKLTTSLQLANDTKFFIDEAGKTKFPEDFKKSMQRAFDSMRRAYDVAKTMSDSNWSKTQAKLSGVV